MQSETLVADVVVIGAGPAGGSAAIEAARGRASVIVVETTGELGGNGAFSTGYVALSGTPFQSEIGVQDSVEKFVHDMEREVRSLEPSFHPEFDLDLAKRYATESSDAYQFLVDIGIRFQRIIPRPRQHTTPRLLTLTDPTEFRTAFEGEFEALGVRALLRRSATKLTVGPCGRVDGVLISSGSEEVRVSARKAVVVAAGGFSANPDMRRKYRPLDDPYAPYVGLDTADGSGILMMQEVGAGVVNMDLIPQYLEGPSRFMEDCIAISGEGRRFFDEAGPYLERVAALREQPGEIGYYLYDATAAARNRQHISELSGRPKELATLEQVERVIGCDPNAVTETVEKWNRLMSSADDRDPDFGRVTFPFDRARIETPPFTVIPITVGIGNTNGGARVNLDLQVLGEDGAAIPGLYAAGDCAGTMNAAMGLGGVHIGSAVTLGRIAGRNAAATRPSPLGGGI
ncbi:FAD-dependent oxidoreductase [Rhodococcus sp. T2V]|uniref:FAD-dependent oxidoreductase n=1 Tax=Rhodococcus sp. T2V TaxID=3034164 RepID=UPI0023E1B998|nr:FAD-dependent oxidoreductase [Rhodococcus sp. T2V]MDF3311854.1 FAD-dependent oxidoreductase [Rhodococcus sp. T2V]